MLAGITGARFRTIYRHFLFITISPFLIVLYILFYPASPWAAYSFEELIPPGWKESDPRDINNYGTVAGSGIDSDGRRRGFIYSEGTYSRIAPPGWERTYVNGINNMGEVVGYGLSGKYKGFYYNKGRYTVILPPGWHEAYAREINDDGVIAGYGREGRVIKGFLYDNGTYTEIMPADWKETYAYGINAEGDVVGYGRDKDDRLRGYIFSDGEYIEILPPEWIQAKAVKINNRGDVTGHGKDNMYKGFIYKDGAYSEIFPGGVIFVEPRDINNRGTVSGRVLYKNGDMEGFVDDGFAYRTVLPSGWRWSQVNAINDLGVVAGSGVRAPGAEKTGFIASGIPEIDIDARTVFFKGNTNEGLPDMTVTVKNDGAADLNIGHVTSPEPPFYISSDACSQNSLRLSETCEITYGVRIKKGSPGKTPPSSSTIPSNDPDEELVTITLGLFPDNDGDGYTLGPDCDDLDAEINPGMTEIPGNDKDDDCNSATED